TDTDLEGWVAVRDTAFAEPSRRRGSVPRGWNGAEGAFAGTCHGRAERRPVGRRRAWSPPSRAAARAARRGRGGLWAVLFPAAPPLALLVVLEAFSGALCSGKVAVDGSSFLAESSSECKAAVSDLPSIPQILQQHKSADTMVALVKVYEEEDEAYQDLVTMATQFYQYLLQPFRDMRELATLYKLEILKSLQYDNLGPRRVAALQKDAEEWTKRAESAVCSIQDITVSYFKETVKALAAMHKQMEQDEERFGKTTWASALPRLENLKYMLAKETLQHLRARELCLKHKKTGIQKLMENLGEQEENLSVVEELEIQYYETQLELYNVQLEVLKHEEMLLIVQLDTIKRQIKEQQDEVVYYDTCENPEELQVIEQTMGQHYADLSAMTLLRQKSKQLETKRGTVCARRAYLRNKKEQCELSHRQRLQQAEESRKRFQQHHSIQIKREKQKEEEKKKKAWISQERQKTLERLKAFREKCPAHVVLKTSCPQPLSPKSPRGIPQQTVVLSPPCASGDSSGTAPAALSPAPAVPAALQQPQSILLVEGKEPKASCQSSPAAIPVQIVVTDGDTEEQKHSEELMVSSPCSPPPPPPPPPCPLHPSSPLPPQLEPQQQQSINPFPSALRCGCVICSPVTDGCFAGSMDEVLASLKRSEVHLHKGEPNPYTSLKDNILCAIRQGVKLRRVNRDPDRDGRKGSPNELERSIKAAMQRIKKVSADSEEEEDNDQSNGEWDS
uniref:WASP homolog associated with actin, golgi membranes and microtubules n=1 Tax=Malurus cyaneus samueli TaxID=2593467 RepID=A0A8C5TXD9_9PASS